MAQTNQEMEMINQVEIKEKLAVIPTQKATVEAVVQELEPEEEMAQEQDLETEVAMAMVPEAEQDLETDGV
jgi:hypothetical protein